MKKTDPKQSQIITYLDELRSEDSKKRINSLNHLKAIAQVLGADRTRTELVPFLNCTYSLTQSSSRTRTR